MIETEVNVDSGVCEKNFAMAARRAEHHDPPVTPNFKVGHAAGEHTQEATFFSQAGALST